jgi:hypothetical protein
MTTTTPKILNEQYSLNKPPIQINWENPYEIEGINTKIYTVSMIGQNTPLYIKFMSALHHGKIKPPKERKFFTPALQIFEDDGTELFTVLKKITEHFEFDVKFRVESGLMKKPLKIFTPIQKGNVNDYFKTSVARLKLKIGKTEFAKLVSGKPEKINVTTGNIHEYITSLSEHDGIIKISVCEHNFGITLRAEVVVDCIARSSKIPYLIDLYG